MATFGWTTKKQTTLYTKQANRKKLAAGAIHKLRSEERASKIAPRPKGLVKVRQKAMKNASKINARK
ncbi:hypothetical protein [Neorhizobium vignae]|uniref:hypothetical protein n=1 Tax=Neorhizobium vignae TaxID=690585 RepID=UPI000560DB3C|nr:hypothetical protein [Neorhizobium vignae]